MDKSSSPLQYITDENGNRIAVILPLQTYEALIKRAKTVLSSPSQPVVAPAQIAEPEIVAEAQAPADKNYDLEQKINFLSEYYEIVNRTLTGLRYYENATAKLDRKLQLQRVITDLESELQDQNKQTQQLWRNADENLVKKLKASNKTTLFDSTEYSLEQELLLLEQHQQLFTKVWEALREQASAEVEHSPQIEKLINTLDNELQNTRWRLGQLKKNVVFAALYNVPELPQPLITREAPFEAIKKQLLTEQKAPLLIQAGSGMGKSVLVAALAQDNEVRKTFPDGIFWICLGKEPNLLAYQTTLIQTLENNNLHFSSLEESAERLHQLCATRALLIVLDDVWDVQDILPFNVMGEHNQIVGTTTDSSLLGILKYFIPEAQGMDIQLFTETQAQQFFEQGIDEKKLKASPIKVETLAQACAYYPAAIKLVAHLANSEELSMGSTLLSELNSEEDELPKDHPIPLMQALRLNIETLGDQADYYLALAVFQDHLHIPEPTVLMLWRYLYQLSEEQAYSFINNVAKIGLLNLSGKIPHRSLSLQLFQYDYLVAEADVKKLHAHLLAAYRRQCGRHGWISGPPDDGYFFEYLGYHLLQAGRRNELRQLLVDYDWLHRKLLATSIHAVTNDFEILEDKALDGLKQVLYESTIVLANDKRELANQLLDRLWETPVAKNNKDIQALLNQAKEVSPNWRWQPHFVPK